MNLVQFFLAVFCLLLITAVTHVNAEDKLDIVDGLQLAKQYSHSRQDINIGEYWVSEKLDGIRARWDGTELRTRNNNKIAAPAWFTANWPKATIDGELWIARGQFERTASIVLSKLTSVAPHSVAGSLPRTESTVDAMTATHSLPSKRWAKVRFMAFDMPVAGQSFDSRLNMLNYLNEATPNPTFAVVPQFTLSSVNALEEKLEQVTLSGGEGVMLHHKKAFYHSGRSDKLLKVKQFEDAEAKVLAHLAGKGKFKGMMGSLLVETPAGVQFKLGTGFSEKERRAPPAVGSWVTFKFYGVTKNGKPRFASFLRVRPPSDLPK